MEKTQNHHELGAFNLIPKQKETSGTERKHRHDSPSAENTAWLIYKKSKVCLIIFLWAAWLSLICYYYFPYCNTRITNA